MIKVIKPAKKQYRCECYHCNAILEFRDEDTLYEHHGGWDFGYDLEYILCPECGTSLTKDTYNCKWEKIE